MPPKWTVSELFDEDGVLRGYNHEWVLHRGSIDSASYLARSMTFYCVLAVAVARANYRLLNAIRWVAGGPGILARITKEFRAYVIDRPVENCGLEIEPARSPAGGSRRG